MESVLNKKHPWETLQLWNDMHWYILLLGKSSAWDPHPRPISVCNHSPISFLPPLIPFTCINLHKHLTGQRGKPLWATGNEGDHSLSPVEGTTLTALRRWSREQSRGACTAARQRQYSAQRHTTNITCTCTGPQEFCRLPAYMCTATAVQTWAYGQCSRIPPPWHLLPYPFTAFHWPVSEAMLGLSTFFLAWTSCHIRALPLSSLSSLSELLSDSSNKTTLEQCFSTFFYCGVFSQGMYITAVKTQKQKKGGFLSGHTSKRKITWRTDRWK